MAKDAQNEKDEKVKLIPFTRRLEEAIETDARRCRRSFVRQVEAVLMTYYGIDDVEVDRAPLEFIGELSPKGKQKVKVLTADAGNEKKKKAG